MSNIIDLQTEDKLQYQFYPVSSGSIQFKVRAPNDAHIALTTTHQESDPMYEIFIGGWGNSKSVIRKNRSKPDKVEIPTPDILNRDEFRGFWVRWEGGMVSAGRENEAMPFIMWHDPEPFPINYVGFCTGWGAVGTWRVEVGPSAPPAALYGAPPGYPAPGGYPTPGGYSVPGGYPAPGGFPGAPTGAAVWVDSNDGQVPPGANPGGRDVSGEELYVARAQHQNATLPGKLARSHGQAYVAWGGMEHGKAQYQVLVGGSGRWVPTSGANLPPGALPGGESEDGEPLYVGRVQHENSLTIGKVQPSHGTCYIPFAGQELGFQEYEVLMS